MPEPIPPQVRAAVLQDVKAGILSQRQIAANHGISPTSVRAIARDAGLTNAFAREQTKKATEALAADNKSVRISVAAMLIADVPRIHKLIWPDDPDAQPTPRDMVALYTAIGIATQRHMELENFDRDTGDTGAKSMLAALMQGLGHAYDKLNPPPADAGS